MFKQQNNLQNSKFNEDTLKKSIIEFQFIGPKAYLICEISKKKCLSVRFFANSQQNYKKKLQKIIYIMITNNDSTNY